LKLDSNKLRDMVFPETAHDQSQISSGVLDRETHALENRRRMLYRLVVQFG
jgi:hypothetical protein